MGCTVAMLAVGHVYRINPVPKLMRTACESTLMVTFQDKKATVPRRAMNNPKTGNGKAPKAVINPPISPASNASISRIGQLICVNFIVAAFSLSAGRQS